jgi:hypothetical protein
MIASKDLTLTQTAWRTKDKSSLSHLHVINAQQSISNDPVSIIKNLAQELAAISCIKQVQAIATSFPDIHWIDFKIELEANIELSDETWNKIQDLVIDCEWKLIDDSGEEWYFRPQIVNSFYQFGNKIIANECKGQKTVSRFKISSSNSPNFVLH